MKQQKKAKMKTKAAHEAPAPEAQNDNAFTLATTDVLASADDACFDFFYQSSL
jgi:hypothetical protein